MKSITSNRALNATDARLLTALSEQGNDIFTTQMATDILGQPSSAVRKRLHHLVKRKWLQRLEKGKYLIVPLSAGMDGHYAENELIVASHLISPYYISYWTALSHYGFTEQPSHTIYVATLKQKKAVTIHGLKYRFVQLQSHKFFGYTPTWIGERLVNVAEREKAIVDALDYPELSGGIIQAAKGLWRGWEELDLNKLIQMALRMRNRAILKRLGYLLEQIGLGSERQLVRLRKNLSAGYAALDSLSPRHGRHDARWRVLVNVADNDLLEWRET